MKSKNPFVEMQKVQSLNNMVAHGVTDLVVEIARFGEGEQDISLLSISHLIDMFPLECFKENLMY